MAISSSSSSSSTFKYDVYISFHGRDTRHGFTSNLVDALRYTKINAFFIDEDLEEGDEITLSAFVNPIQHSKTAIIVLSKNYAMSSFRLEELSYILDNFQGKVIPVFYYVEPSNVRSLEGTFGQAFAMLEEKFKDNKQKVQKWRNALTQIANVSRFHLVAWAEYEYKFIERIVNEVFLHTTVGLKDPLKEVKSLLLLYSGAEVYVAGIYGEAEIGKTTLARVVYGTISGQFEASYFIPDMGENSNSNIHTHLQNILLTKLVGKNSISIPSAQERSLLIQERLQDKKVLLVLDGVDKLEQLEDLVDVTGWLGSGSRIIITTRNKSLLGFYGIVRTYEVLPLDDIDALELLSQHIFKDGNADRSNTGTLNELVTYAAGLPLALKAIGSYLLGKSVDEWKNALRQFKRVHPKDIYNVLQTSHSVSGVFSKSTQVSPTSVDPPSASEAFSNSSQGAAEQTNFPNASEALSNSSQGGSEQGNPRGSHETSTRPEGVDWETWFWRVVGTLSGVVGPLFFALGPPSKCVMKEQKLLFILCSTWTLVIWVFLHCVKPTEFSKRHRLPICYVVFLILSAYSFFYDKAIDNKPSVYTVVSNAAFALVSLSKSEMDRFDFETGTFCYFLVCFTTQLLHIKWWLFFVAMLLSCPLFLFHFLSKSKDGNGDQTLPLLIQKTRNLFNQNLALLKTLHLFNPKINQKILPIRMPKENDTGPVLPNSAVELQNSGKKVV